MLRDGWQAQLPRGGRDHPEAVSYTHLVCLVTVLGVLPPGAGLALAGVALLGYVALLGADRRVLRRLAVHHGWAHWLRAAVVEEERDLESAIRVPRALSLIHI